MLRSVAGDRLISGWGHRRDTCHMEMAEMAQTVMVFVVEQFTLLWFYTLGWIQSTRSITLGNRERFVAIAVAIFH